MQKSNAYELLDEINHKINKEDLFVNLKELDFINKYLGGHAINNKAFLNLAKNINGTIDVVEIGCGGGDNLRALANVAKRNNIPCNFIGIDAKSDCIEYAKSNSLNFENITYIHSRYEECQLHTKPHVVFNSLFCHHFNDEQLVTMLKWMKENSSVGFFINDLHRHTLAYFSIKILTQLFSKSYLVKNDAPLSVQRGFTYDDWKLLFQQANFSAKIIWKWAFRYLILFKHV